jgi:hypothetical protein
MCDVIYEQRDHYLKHGSLPEKENDMPDLVVDPIKIPVALANAERYVRQYKNKLSKKPDDVNAVKQMEKYQRTVIEYKKILKLDT